MANSLEIGKRNVPQTPRTFNKEPDAKSGIREK
jgi:hypothetical protein